MNVSFYLRNDQVYVYVTFNSQRVRTSTGVKAKKLKGENVPGDPQATNLLLLKKSLILNLYYDCEKNGVEMTREDIIKCLNGYVQPKIKKKTFFEYYEEWIEESKTKISPITRQFLAAASIKRYSTTKSVLEDFEVASNFKLTTQSINADFENRFKKYILTERINENTKKAGCSVNTFSDHIKQIKVFCVWLQKKEPSLSNDFRGFKKPFSYSDAEPLKESELQKLYDASFVGYKEKARLVLLFLCSTGMRISDYNLIEHAKFDGEMIVFRAKKNHVVCYVPNFDDHCFRPKFLYEKLATLDGSISKISGQKLNDAIKVICLELGITRIIPTSKTGRKTFATLKLLQGVAPEIIMKSTGHKTRGAFDAYVGIDTSDILKAYKDKAVNLKVG